MMEMEKGYRRKQELTSSLEIRHALQLLDIDMAFFKKPSSLTATKNKQKSNARIPRKCESDQRRCQVRGTPGGVLPPSLSQGVGFSSHEAGEGEEQL
ncbi:hypothetical protein FCV25MIE_11794 [Fagus crenata]